MKRLLGILVLIAIAAGCGGGGGSSGGVSSDAELSALTVSEGTLSPAFSSAIRSYDCSIGTAETVSITATAQESGSIIEINGVETPSGTESAPIAITGSALTAVIGVTAPDGVSQKHYLIDLKKGGSSQTASPVFSLPSGTTFKTSLIVALTCATNEADVRYTLDGSSPISGAGFSAGAIPYEAAISLTSTTTIKAAALKAGMPISSVAVATYTQSDLEQVDAPVFTPGNGTTFPSTLEVSITTTTSGATIHYTTNGADPTAASSAYSGPIIITESCTVKAIAVKSGMNNSPMASAEYQKQATQTVAAPEFNPVSGQTFTTTLSVSASTATAGADVYYTLDPSAAKADFIKLSGSISLTESATVRAFGRKTGMNDSSIVSATYTKDTNAAATPTFSPGNGTRFTDTLSVSLSCATAGADIYYSTSPTAQKTDFTKYATAIQLTDSATIRAFSRKTGLDDSAIASASYTKGGEHARYKTNPNGQVGKYKSGMNVTCVSTKSDGFTDWSSDMIIAQGAAYDDAKSFYGGHEYPSYDSYTLYAAWDDTNLYLGWQFVYVNDIANPSNNGGNEAKPTNGDIPQMLVFDIDSTKASIGTKADGKNVWYDTSPTGFNFDLSLGVDKIAMFSSKGGVGQPALFSVNAEGFFDYTAANCKLFNTLGIVYGAVDGLLPAEVWGVKKYPYVVADLDGTSDWIDFVASGHNKSYDQFYEMKIPLASLGITRSDLETKGIGIMHISIYGTSGVNSLPFDKATLDNAFGQYSKDTSTSKEKEDLDVFTSPLARIGKM